MVDVEGKEEDGIVAWIDEAEDIEPVPRAPEIRLSLPETDDEAVEGRPDRAVAIALAAERGDGGRAGGSLEAEPDPEEDLRKGSGMLSRGAH